VAIDHVILHAEAASSSADGFGGVRQTDKLGVACVVLYEYRADRFRVFGPWDVGQLQQRLVQADWVSGYDLLRFDYPLLWGQGWDKFRMGNVFRPLSARTNDLVRRICLAQGMHPDAVADYHRVWTLGALGQGTVGRGRAGTGVEAAGHFRAGNWPAAVSFALDAAGLVKNLVDFVERYGYVVHGETGYRCDLRRAGPRSPLLEDHSPTGA
jgi:hypothetical protein